MKVISGKLKGRTIQGFHIEGTRPTMDRIKESLFAIIQNNIENKIVLDLFSGSGNLAIEAISNGASFAYINDKNKKACDIMKENVKNFHIQDQTKILNLDYEKALQYFTKQKIKFDLIFLDPPYKMHIIPNILKTIEKNQLLEKEALIICESDSPLSLNLSLDLTIIKEKKYGDKIVTFLKKNCQE